MPSRSSYLNKVFGAKGAEPLTQPLHGRDAEMVANHDGAQTFQITDFAQAKRFVLLGSQGGSYYATEQKLTLENADAVKRAIEQDGLRVVEMVVEISDKGKAPKNDPALFVLAMCLAFGDPETKTAAKYALPKVARIGTHLMHFAEYVNGMRGWGRGLKGAFENWYIQKSNRSLAQDVVKYASRDGWSHRDILRLTKPKTTDPTLNAVYHYVAKGWESVGETPHDNPDLLPIWAAERAKAAQSDREILPLIAQYGLPMECVPTHLRTREVYEALIPGAGVTWLLRNLGNLSKTGAIATGRYSNLNAVVGRLASAEELKKGRVHPLSILVALNTYKNGGGVRSDATWPVLQEVVDALDEAFYLAFDAIEPSGARFVLGCDVSGSMATGAVAGMTGITPRVATAVMAMASKRVEKASAVMGFTHQLVPLNITPKMRLDQIVQVMSGLPFGATRVALPMEWALKNRVEADCFVIYTDNDVNTGGHPVNALKAYRDKTGINAKLIVVAMLPYNFSVADPKDPGMLDVHGFSTDAPAVISAFAAGAI